VYCSDFLRPEESKAYKGTTESFTWKDHENCHADQQGNSLRTESGRWRSAEHVSERKMGRDVLLNTQF